MVENLIKVNLPSINQDDFYITESLVSGDRCFLVNPKKMFYGWTRSNLILRSSMWTETGLPVSLSFKKFFNWGEGNELTYTPFSMTANGGIEMIEKLDGSTLIVSKYKGEMIIRTRGTTDARRLENGYELETLRAMYPHIFDGSYCGEDTCQYSLLFEWLSPTNQIVIPHLEADMIHIGMIGHEKYDLYTQTDVDYFAKIHNLKRPRRFYFESIKELIESIPTQKDFEGLCVYCNKGQDIRKIKTDWYVKMHHALTVEFSTFEGMVEFYFGMGMPATYSEFFDTVTKFRDYEVANHVRGDISRIIDAMKEVRLIHSKYTEFANSLKASNMSRKDVADKIFSTHGKTNRAGMIFHLYDGISLNSEEWKKLFYQVIKK